MIGRKIKKEGHLLSEAWHIPGGRVEKGESSEDTLIREFKEETNLEIVIEKKIATIFNKQTKTRVYWYLCHPVSFELKPGDDLAEVKFVDKKDALKLCDTKAILLWPNEVMKFFNS